MSETTVVAVVTIVLVILPVLWALSGWLFRRSLRALLRGVGLALVPIGLVLTGLMRLLVRAIHLVVDWFAGTAMTTTIWIGVVVIAIGLVTWFIAGFMSPVDRETGRQRRQDHAARKQARSKTASPQSTSTGSASLQKDSQQTTSQKPRKNQGTTTRAVDASKIPAAEKDEDAELEAILRKRGIE